jgi:RNA polymerase sigma factor (sigma-70 family)
VKNDAKKHRDEKVKQWQELSIESSEPGVRYQILWKRVIDVEEQAEFNEKYEAFLKAFTDLTSQEQVALSIKFGLQLTYKEISSILNESEGTIKPRIWRARKKLREQLGKDYPDLLDKEDDEKEKDHE